MSTHPRTIRGRISYIFDPAGERREYGRESWSVTTHDDGQRTLRAVCEIEPGVAGDRHVFRDTTIGLDAEFFPLDCFTRLHRNGRFLGSGWFRFAPGVAEAEVFSAEAGRFSQSMPVRGRVASFGAHNLTCDVLHCARYDHHGPRVQHPAPVFLSNLEHDGCGGPILAPISFGLEYLGRERVSVPAGTFDADHYQFLLAGSLPQEHPTEHAWCLPGTFLFVRIAVGGYMNSAFELVELSA